MRVATTIRRGPVQRAKRRPPGRLDSHRNWTDRRGLDQESKHIHEPNRYRNHEELPGCVSGRDGMVGIPIQLGWQFAPTRRSDDESLVAQATIAAVACASIVSSSDGRPIHRQERSRPSRRSPWRRRQRIPSANARLILRYLDREGLFRKSCSSHEMMRYPRGSRAPRS
jgi:hypothetical protein